MEEFATNEREAARIAYEAYNADRGGVAYDGSLIPAWDAVREDIRHAWTVAAVAVRKQMVIESL